jgi:hypothetical protein
MDRNTVRLFGLKTRLVLRELEATFCDVGFAGCKDSSELRKRYRDEMTQQIDSDNKETCIKIANIYETAGNKEKSKKYWNMAKRYAHMGVPSN